MNMSPPTNAVTFCISNSTQFHWKWCCPNKALLQLYTFCVCSLVLANMLMSKILQMRLSLIWLRLIVTLPQVGSSLFPFPLPHPLPPKKQQQQQQNKPHILLPCITVQIMQSYTIFFTIKHTCFNSITMKLSVQHTHIRLKHNKVLVGVFLYS